MDEGLNERVLAIVERSGANDYDQRSALGMARTWLEKHKAVVRSMDPVMGRRDDLAESLIEEIKDMDRDDATEALALARDWVNAPYVDPTMNGQRVKASIEKEERE